MISKLERKFGKYAIRNLMKYVVLLYVLGFIIFMVGDARGIPVYYGYLSFDIDKILHGQVWRLVTWLIQPLDYDIFFMLLAVYLYYIIGSSLENAWGSFRFNLFYFGGVILNMLAAVIIYIVLYVWSDGQIHFTYPISLHYINLAMFCAFGTIFANVQFLLFFFIPIKVKYLTWIYLLIELYNVVDAFINGGFLLGMCIAIMLIVSMLNYIIFFLWVLKATGRTPAAAKRRSDFQKEYNSGVRQSSYRSTVTMDNSGRARAVITRHKCAVCGRTELDDDELEFRFCSKCDGNYEYCMDHLYTHTHVVREYTNQDQ